MLLYKKFYSQKYDIPLDKIKVEYQILKERYQKTLNIQYQEYLNLFRKWKTSVNKFFGMVLQIL